MVDSVGTLFAEAEERGVVELTRNLDRLADSADRAERSLDNFNDQSARGQRVQRGGGGAGGGSGGGAGGGLYAAVAAQALLASKNTGDLSTATRNLSRDFAENRQTVNQLLRDNQGLVEVSRQYTRNLNEQSDSLFSNSQMRDNTNRQIALNESRISSLRAETDKATQSNERSNRVLSGLGTTALVTGGSLAVLAIGVLAVATNASRASLSLGRAVAETSTLLEGTSGQIRELTQRSAELAGTFGGTAASQALGFYAIYSAGAENATQALDTLIAANRFAIGGVTDLASATQLLTGTLNAYSAFGYDAVQVSDIFFEVIRNGITTAERLAASFANVSSIAAGFGVNLQVTGSAVAALTATGTQTAMATTQVRAFITALQNLNDEQRAAIRGLGVTSTAPADFAQIVRELEVGLSSFSTATERSAALGEVFGSQIEALAAALSLTGGGFNTFERTLDATNNSLGATSRAFNKIATSDAQMLEVSLGRIEEANTKLGASVNRIAIPAFSSLSEVISGTADNLENLRVITEQGGFLGYLAAIFSSDEARQIAADNIREQRLVTESNEQVMVSNNLLASSYGSLAQAQINAAASGTLTADRELLGVANVLIERIRERNQLINDVAYAELLAGNISQRQYDARIIGEEALTDAILARDSVQQRVDARASAALVARLNNTQGRITPDSQLAVGAFTDALDTNQTPEQQLFAERTAFYQAEEVRLNASLDRILLDQRRASAETLDLYVLQGARVLQQIRNNTTSWDAEFAAFHKLQNQRDRAAADARLEVLQAEADAFVAGVVSRAQRTYDANLRAAERQRREDERNTQRRLRDIEAEAQFRINRAKRLAQDELDVIQRAAQRRVAIANNTTSALSGAQDLATGGGSISGAASTATAIFGEQGVISGIAGSFTPFLMAVSAAIPPLAAFATAVQIIPDLIGRQTQTGFNVSAGLGGITSEQATNRESGLSGFFRLLRTGSRNGVEAVTDEQSFQLRRAFEPINRELVEIAEISGRAFRDVAVHGRTAEEVAFNYGEAIAGQVGGLERFRTAGQSLVSTLGELVRAAESLDDQYRSVGLGSSGFGRNASLDVFATGLLNQAGGPGNLGALNTLRPEQTIIAISQGELERVLGRGSNAITDPEALVSLIAGQTNELSFRGRVAQSSLDAYQSQLDSITNADGSPRRGFTNASVLAAQTRLANERREQEAILNPIIRRLRDLTSVIDDFNVVNPDAAITDDEPAEREARGNTSRITLGNEQFATEAERRIAETTLNNTIGMELDERRNAILDSILAKLPDPNGGDVVEGLRDQRIIDARTATMEEIQQ